MGHSGHHLTEGQSRERPNEHHGGSPLGPLSTVAGHAAEEPACTAWPLHRVKLQAAGAPQGEALPQAPRGSDRTP